MANKISEAVKRENKIVFKTYPRIFKSDDLLTIVYSDHSEMYKLKSKDNFKEMSERYDYEMTGESEINMLKGNGFKEVHYGKEVE